MFPQNGYEIKKGRLPVSLNQEEKPLLLVFFHYYFFIIDCLFFDVKKET